jgi:hypothetical protein
MTTTTAYTSNDAASSGLMGQNQGQSGVMKVDICDRCASLYRRLPHAKSGLCCSCRKDKRESEAPARRLSADPLAFQSQAELDAWYSHDLLRCHICGEHTAGLSQHIIKKHGVTPDEYRLRFNIPSGYGLSGRATRIKQRACAAATLDKMRDSGFANLEKARAAKKEKKP